MKKVLVIILFFCYHLTNGQDTPYSKCYAVGKNGNNTVEVHMAVTTMCCKIKIWANRDTLMLNEFPPDTESLKPIFKHTPIDSVTPGQLVKIYNDLKSACEKTADPLKITQIDVYPKSRKGIAHFGDRLEIHGNNFQAIIRKSDTATNPIVLYLDNYKLTTIKGDVVNDSIINFTLNENLDATEQDKNFWTDEYNESIKQDHHGVITPVLKIGTKDGRNTSSSAPTFRFRIYSPCLKMLLWGIFIAICISIFFAAWKTNILRETCECQCSDDLMKKKKNARPPFSLSRTQMAFWTIIVAFSFTYIYVITGEMPNITTGTLILLGISSSTTLGGSLLDSTDTTSKSQNAPLDRCCSENFFKDILSDGGIPGIHRLQNILFTVIMGGIYLCRAVGDLYLTEFDTNLLVLMGISSGTYLGVKFFANQSLAQNAQTITLKTPTPITVAK
ncbi:MAG TPA: hypothetical protein VK808_14295, partial [Bacteroidia bacterium]|nr:hypothetical protein [Bacteroidia bacterium]